MSITDQVRLSGSQEDGNGEEASPQPRLFGFGTRKVKKSARETEGAVKAASRPAKRVAMQVRPRFSTAPRCVHAKHLRCSAIELRVVHILPYPGPRDMGNGTEQLPCDLALSQLDSPVSRFQSAWWPRQ